MKRIHYLVTYFESRLALVGLIGLSLILVSCAQPPEVSLPPTPTAGVEPTQTLAATATPEPPSNLFICLAEEPTSLYLYSDTSREADVIFEGLYQTPVDLVDFQWHSDVLEKIPSLADGDAEFETITAGFGDVYLNPETLVPERLGNGDPYLPVGCRSLECSQTFQGGQVEMERLRVLFQLKGGLTWSDGQPVTVADSIFSFETAGHPDTPSSKYLFSRTFAYQQVDELSLEWIGIPGFFDDEYASNFWTPLPRHVLGDLPAAELLGAPEAALTPMGYGPYQIEEWQQGRQLVMSRNPEYSGEVESGFDRLIFRFIGDDPQGALDQLATGECDVLDEALLPLASLDATQAAIDQMGATLQAGPGSVVERLEFALRPAVGSEYLHLLDQVELRRAIGSCVDRVGLAESLFGGASAVPASFLPPDHPDYSPGQTPIEYDLEAGQFALDELGWLVPEEGDGVRVALGVDGLANDTRLSFTVLTLPGQLQQRALARIQSDLAECGVELTIESLTAAELFAPWPEGPIFGRRFQMALWAWPTFYSPACEMFAGWEIPSEDSSLGINASGYQSTVYDAACRAVLLGAPSTPSYQEAMTRLQDEFSADVPALPLFVRPRLLAHADWLCGPAAVSSAATLFWNLEEWAPCP